MKWMVRKWVKFGCDGAMSHAVMSQTLLSQSYNNARMSHCYKMALMSNAIMSHVHKCCIDPHDALMLHSITFPA